MILPGCLTLPCPPECYGARGGRGSPHSFFNELTMQTKLLDHERGKPSDSTSQAGGTRCFWLGYLFGGIAGAVIGLLFGDLAGWVYMCGTVGCFVALAFDPASHSTS